MSDEVAWVARRARCTADLLFVKIRVEARRVVDTANANARRGLGVEFKLLTEGDDFFEVGARDTPWNTLQHAFRLRTGAIIAERHGPGPEGPTKLAEATPHWNAADLTCWLRVTTETDRSVASKTCEGFVRMVLEPLIFPR